MAWETRVARTEQEIAALAGEWERCREQQARRHMEQHPEWLLLESRRRLMNGAMVVTLYRDGSLVGVAPFLLRRWDFRWRAGSKTVVRFPMRSADFCGEEWIAPADSQAQEAFLRGILEACASCQVIRFEYLPVDSCLWARLYETPFLRERHWVHNPWGVSVRWLVRLAATFEDYLSKFSYDTRRKLKQEARKLEKACQEQLCLHRITQRAHLPTFLQAVERLSALSWQGTRLGKVIHASEEEMERLGGWADRGWLRGYLLTNGDQPLSFLIGRQADGTYYADHTGYDPEWARLAPGKVLWYRMLEDLHRVDRPEWMDFRRGNKAYKQFFANHSYNEGSAYLMRKTAYAGLAVGFPAAFSRIRTATHSLFNRLGLLAGIRRLRSRSRRTPH